MFPYLFRCSLKLLFNDNLFFFLVDILNSRRFYIEESMYGCSGSNVFNLNHTSLRCRRDNAMMKGTVGNLT
jgi:hypothetical protein